MLRKLKVFALGMCISSVGIVENNSLYAEINLETLRQNCIKGKNCAPFGGRGHPAWDKCNSTEKPPINGTREQACTEGYKVMARGECIIKCLDQPGVFSDKAWCNMDFPNAAPEVMEKCVQKFGNSREKSCSKACLSK